MRNILIGWPRLLGLCPTNGCVAVSKCFRGCRDLAPMEERGRGRHSLLMQHSTQRIAARQGRQRHTGTEQHNTHQSSTAQCTVHSHRANKGADDICMQFSLVALDTWTPPRLRVCGGIQVFGGYRELVPIEIGAILCWCSIAHSAMRHARADRGAQRNKAAQDNAMPSGEYEKAPRFVLKTPCSVLKNRPFCIRTPPVLS